MEREDFEEKYNLDWYEGMGVEDFVFGIELVYKQLNDKQKLELLHDIVNLDI